MVSGVVAAFLPSAALVAPVVSAVHVPALAGNKHVNQKTASAVAASLAVSRKPVKKRRVQSKMPGQAKAVLAIPVALTVPVVLAGSKRAR